MKLAELHWPEVKQLDREKIVAVVPVGSMEQHGPHLPFQVDVLVSSRLAEDLERKIPEILLVPPFGRGFRHTIWTFRAPSPCAPKSSWTFCTISAPRCTTTVFAASFS